MFIANLKILDIKIPIGINAYHDDGYINSVVEHFNKLSKKYSNLQPYDKEIEFNGMSVEGRGKIRKHFHIFYRDQVSEPLNLRTRAHEETHALDFFGWLNRLENKLLTEQGININFDGLREDLQDSYIDQQVRAEIGAIYTLKSRNIDLKELKGKVPEYFDYALDFYEKHKVNN